MITHLYSYVAVGCDPMEEDPEEYYVLAWELGNGATEKLFRGELDSLYSQYYMTKEEIRSKNDLIFV